MQKILINGITLDQANPVALVGKIRYWQKHHCQITVIGNQQLRQTLAKHHLRFNFIHLKNTKNPKTIFQFIIEAIKRNFLVLPLLPQIKKQPFSYIYSLSSVLDLLILPFCLKIIQPTIKWISVFDNTVTTKSSPLLAYILHRVSLILLKKCDHIFVPTASLKKSLINHRLSKNKITITGNGIENNLIKNTVRPKNPKFDAIFVGRLNSAKGIYDLLDILKIVKRKYPSFILAVMGRGDQKTEKQFKDKINQLKLKQNIKFLGFKTGQKKFNLIKNSKIFLFPSHTESFGIALLEAVCCGLPALAYNLPIYASIYRNQEIFSFPLGNTQSVAKKILQIFNKKQFNNPAGKKLLDKYSWNKIAAIELSQICQLTA